jgi:WXXGXW repeat (2 copies)
MGDPERVPQTPPAPAVHYYAPHPPPAPHEDRVVAPGPGYFWAPGYFRWDGREHVWTPGTWSQRHEGLDYVAPHWENVYSRYEYIPGRWFHEPK